METSSENDIGSEFNFSSEHSDALDGGLNIDRDSIVNLQEVNAAEARHSNFFTTIRVGEKDYPVLTRETPSFLVNHILRHNDLHGFTLVTYIGKSGTGKSTLTRTLTHYLHTRAEKNFGRSYVPMWFKQKDIESLDDIIGSLEVGVNRILNFEDVSFTFNYSDQGDIDEVMRKLTYIRHTLKAKVIIQMQIHYTKALDKFLRDGDVKIITSMTDEEKENLLRLFTWDAKKQINQFATKYYSMEANGFWYASASLTKVFKYQVQKPFRLALVSDFGRLHNLLYHDVSCDYCKPKFEEAKTTKYDTSDVSEFLRHVSDTYNPGRMRAVLRHYLYYKEGLDTLEPKSKYVISRLSEYFQARPDQYQGLIDEVKKSKTLDSVLRRLGVWQAGETYAEKRKKRNINAKEQRLLRKRLLDDKPVTITADQLSDIGVASMDAGPMTDEDIAGRSEGQV